MVKGKTAKLVFAGLMAALTVAALYLGAALPTGRLGFAALGSLFVFAALWETGLRGAILCCVTAALLGFLLVPEKLAVLFFSLFFGPYPVLRTLAERLRPIWARWAVKLAFLWAALSALMFLFDLGSADLVRRELPAALLFLLAAAALVAFDLCLEKLRFWWMRRFHNIT